MILIRQEQMRVLEQACWRQFEDRMAAHIRARFPYVELTRDDVILRDFVVSSIGLGETFGVEQEYDLRRFIEFRAEYGENFHLLDWAAKILADRTLSGCGKMEQIDDHSLYVLR